MDCRGILQDGMQDKRFIMYFSNWSMSGVHSDVINSSTPGTRKMENAYFWEKEAEQRNGSNQKEGAAEKVNAPESVGGI